jgi:mannose-6-phosphate isomerase-like protein (cupin superfamily)
MTTSPKEPRPINRETKGEWLQTRPGERCSILATAADTEGGYSVVEIVSQPGDGTPVHLHHDEDEHFIILEGTARILYGDKTFDAPAGTSITLTRNIRHAWCNPFSSPFRMVAIASPGGCEEALRMIARGEYLDIDIIRQRFGIEILGPPMLTA